MAFSRLHFIGALDRAVLFNLCYLIWRWILYCENEGAFEGILQGSITTKVLAFADDLLLFVSNPKTALPVILKIFRNFARVSGFRINYTKSEALAIFPSARRGWPMEFPFKWRADSIKYLGVNLPAKPSRLYCLNITPLIHSITQELSSWKALPLSFSGRCHLIKMVSFPKLLFVLQSLPLFLTRGDEKLLNRSFCRFI